MTLAQSLYSGESTEPNLESWTNAVFDRMALGEYLNNALREISSGEAQTGMETLTNTLNDVRSSVPELEWHRLISSCRAHPICSLFIRIR